MLKQLKMEPIVTHPCIFKSRDGNLILCLCVDDSLLLGLTEEKVNKLIKDLKKKYEITDGSVDKYVGLTINRAKNAIFLNQENYIKEIIANPYMTEAKISKIPFNPFINQSLDEEREGEINYPYQNVIGMLNFVANTLRPDLSYTVSCLAQFN